MKVITVINDKNHLGFTLLRMSCTLNGLELVALVSGSKVFSSNRIKDELLKRYLDEQHPSDEPVFFTDGIDTILMAGEAEILDKFSKTGKEIVFSTETQCWPDARLAPLYPQDGGGPYRYLNSGGFVGRPAAIKALLGDGVDADLAFRESNQYLWAKRFLGHGDVIGLDSGCELFHTFSPEIGERYLEKGVGDRDQWPYYFYMKKWFRKNFSIRRGRIYSNITQTWPCQAHFNGYAKMLIDEEIVSMVLAMAPDGPPTQFVSGRDHARIK